MCKSCRIYLIEYVWLNLFRFHSCWQYVYVHMNYLYSKYISHNWTFYSKKYVFKYFNTELIFLGKCNNDSFVKCRAFTFCKKSHFSKNVNQVLFDVIYLCNHLLDKLKQNEVLIAFAGLKYLWVELEYKMSKHFIKKYKLILTFFNYHYHPFWKTFHSCVCQTKGKIQGYTAKMDNPSMADQIWGH